MILEENTLLNDHKIKCNVVSDLIKELYSNTSIEFNNEIRDALSSGQLASKIALTHYNISQLKIPYLKILIVGGWYGTLSKLLLDRYPLLKITSLDIDNNCEIVATRYVNNKNFRALTGDMYNYTNYHLYDMIINTSCEHIPNFSEWLDLIPSRTCVILQSNNFIHRQHIDVSNSLDDFISKIDNKLSIINTCTIKCTSGGYDRYMISGRKK